MEQHSQKMKLLFAVFLGMVLGAGVVGGIVWRLESSKAEEEAAIRIAAQRKADKFRSASHLRGIGIGLIMYARNNEGVFPAAESWSEPLVAQGLIISKMLVSPIEDGDGISYIFVPGPNSMDPSQILAYEDPKHMDEGVHVVFADTSTSTMNHFEFERMLAEQLATQDDQP
jgi:hypothetical protein